MTQSKGLILLIVAVIIVTLLSLFTVKEGQKALVLRLGDIKHTGPEDASIIYQPGLHIKAPLIDTAEFFDTRLQTLEQTKSRVLTKEQKYLIIDYYVKWRIGDIPLYYKSTSNYTATTETLLRQKINDALRAEIGKRFISDIISGDRADIMQLLLNESQIAAKTLGVDLVDVRIKRIDLPEEVSRSVYERMRADRQRVAAKHRSNGRAQAEAIQAKAEANATVIIASAKEQGASVRAQGKEQAAKLYNAAYLKSPDFYNFYRSLLAYKHSFHTEDTIMLNPKTNHGFFQFFPGANNK